MRAFTLALCWLCCATTAVADDGFNVGDVIQLRLPAEMKLKYEQAKAGSALIPVTPYSDRDRAVSARLFKDNEGWKLQHTSEWNVNGQPLLITIEAKVDLNSIQTEPVGMPKFLSEEDKKAYENALRQSPPTPRRYVDISRQDEVKMRFWRLAN